MSSPHFELHDPGNEFLMGVPETRGWLNGSGGNAEHFGDGVHYQPDDGAGYLHDYDARLPAMRLWIKAEPFAKAMTGITLPRRLITPSTKGGELGTRVRPCMRMISWTFKIGRPYSSSATLKLTS